ncbi:hypothetical protein AB0P21_30600 [Kribbella sp. NPDC056861]|uniref:hypothetical protein n=1 Tax=Kribbella sp. NPDC056861 TaxID=3154857 RepID=UPI00342208EC
MTARLVAQLTVVLIGLLTMVAPAVHVRSARKNLRDDLLLNLQLLRELPAESRQRGELTAHVERQFEARLARLDAGEQPTVESPSLVVAAVATAIGVAAIGLGGNWYFALIFTGLAFLLTAFPSSTSEDAPDAGRPQDAVPEKPAG